VSRVGEKSNFGPFSLFFLDMRPTAPRKIRRCLSLACLRAAERPGWPTAGVLSSKSGWDLSESEIYHTDGNKISGNITYQRGQGKEKLSLKFTDMLMSGMLPDAARP
jgi:hypothetical protein